MATINEALELLGQEVKDKVTKVRGVVTSVSFDLTGCIQGLVRPPVQKDGKLPDPYWVDTSRLELSDIRVMPCVGFKGDTIPPGPETKPV